MTSANGISKGICGLALALAIGAASALSLPAIAQEAAAPAAGGDAAAAGGDAAVANVAFPSIQVRRGTPLYRDNCASCHGDRLQGALEAPALSGEDFRANWFGQPLSALYEYTASYMPQDRPGALEPQEYADIIAFILRNNGIEPTDGAEELPGDPAALAEVMLPAPEAVQPAQ